MIQGANEPTVPRNGGAMMSSPQSDDVVQRLVVQLDKAMASLRQAKPFAKSIYQTDVFQFAEALMAKDEGLEALYSRAHLFDQVGVFAGGPWAEPTRLRPALVAGSLKASGVYPVVETLSELRMLAIAKRETTAPDAEVLEATEFLNETLALNLEFVFPGDTEQERIEGGPHRESNIRLFRLLAERLDLSSLLEDVLREIEQISAQRPIMTNRLRRMVEMASRIPQDTSPEMDRLKRYQVAISGPSQLSQMHVEVAAYRDAIADCDAATLRRESEAFARSISDTGLVCPHHAVLLRHLRAAAPELLDVALGLNDVGAAELEQNKPFVLQLIKVAVLPTTAQCIYGFARLLERGMLSRQEVSEGLRRIVDLDLQSDVRKNLLARKLKRDGVTANSLLLAGTISVLGQPLGVGQGKNPTCQAARGISLWAQHAPGMLLQLLVSAARDGLIEITFESDRLRSNELSAGLATKLDMELDPVSIVLVPHLDRVYNEMMNRVALRKEDGHKWVNPAFYGRWVHNGFSSVFADIAQTTVADYDEFVRRFFATHHPAYNDGHTLMYPNPVGLCITNSRGDYLGPHAISLLRVADDPQGSLRAYFFNPNNEGRQDWGQGVRPSISGHGEEEGECSLLFHEFAARLYAFHYNPYEEGDAYAVPDKTIAEIDCAARGTWGKAFTWS